MQASKHINQRVVLLQGLESPSRLWERFRPLFTTLEFRLAADTNSGPRKRKKQQTLRGS